MVINFLWDRYPGREQERLNLNLDDQVFLGIFFFASKDGRSAGLIVMAETLFC